MPDTSPDEQPSYTRRQVADRRRTLLRLIRQARTLAADLNDYDPDPERRGLWLDVFNDLDCAREWLLPEAEKELPELRKIKPIPEAFWCFDCRGISDTNPCQDCGEETRQTWVICEPGEDPAGEKTDP